MNFQRVPNQLNLNFTFKKFFLNKQAIISAKPVVKIVVVGEFNLRFKFSGVFSL